MGFIGFNDAYGENWYKVFGALAQNAGVTIVANERYARTDSSVTAQVLKLSASRPDAVLIAAVGGPAVLPQATLYDQGYGAACIRRTQWQPTTSSGSARRRSKARCSQRVRCW